MTLDSKQALRDLNAEEIVQASGLSDDEIAAVMDPDYLAASQEARHRRDVFAAWIEQHCVACGTGITAWNMDQK